MWNSGTCDCECYKACKIVEYLNIKNCLCKKNGKLVLACEDERLNTTENTVKDLSYLASVFDKKNCMKK